MEYSKIRGPIGFQRDDILAAQIAMYASVRTGGEVRLSDFMPPWTPPPSDDEDD